MAPLVYLKSVLAGLAALAVSAILVVGVLALALFAVSRRSGSVGIGAVSVGISDGLLWLFGLGGVLIFAAGFWWEFRRASR
jgi:hypothetical protein